MPVWHALSCLQQKQERAHHHPAMQWPNVAGASPAGESVLLAAGFLLPMLLATVSSASCSSFLAPLGVLGRRCGRAQGRLNVEGASLELAPGQALPGTAIAAGCCPTAACCSNSHAAPSSQADSSPWKALLGSCLHQRCAMSDGRDLGGAVPAADGADLLECQDSQGSTFPRPYVTCSCGQWACEHGWAAADANNKGHQRSQGLLVSPGALSDLMTVSVLLQDSAQLLTAKCFADAALLVA